MKRLYFKGNTTGCNRCIRFKVKKALYGLSSYRFMIKILIFLSFVAFGAAPACADDFGPWDASVKIGDGLLERSGSHRHIKGNVYGGVQSGAYFMIRFFQIAISPQDGPSCRFSPVCSTYGRISVERFGALWGSLLAGDRILRCNFYSRPGRDPVPESLGHE